MTTNGSEARSRLLTTATRLFYTEGIHSVGVDRIVAEAKVTRATLYRHFPGKDDLIVCYLQEADHAIRGNVDAIVARRLSASETLRAIAAS
ncbi:TetR/AcrR family transcriptional regulator, partial [Kibdelosporangium lantanae]